MSSSKDPTTQHLAGNFVLCAGSVLFRRSANDVLEICLLYYTPKQEWLLPKGRKDRGESLETTAVRETYEETGYMCELSPQRMPTRAPIPDVDSEDVTVVADSLVEPIAITIRDRGAQGVKVISWYITFAKGEEKAMGTQTESETFESSFVEANAAIERLTFQNDREVVEQALKIVTGDGRPHTASL